jgi:hypothetical protein
MTKADRARVAFLKSKLSTDPRWAVAGLLRIYENQTDAEKAVGNTQEFNGIGFSGCDGDFLSSLSVQAKRKGLSPKQIKCVHKTMPKYAAQLLKASDITVLDKAMLSG